jgi:hypothetical protein
MLAPIPNSNIPPIQRRRALRIANIFSMLMLVDMPPTNRRLMAIPPIPQIMNATLKIVIMTEFPVLPTFGNGKKR